MTRMQLARWQLPFPTAMALVVLGGILPACRPRSPEPLGPPQPGAACRPGVAPSTRAELDACVQGLKFDSAPEASDSQPLTVINGTAPAARCPGDGKKTCRFGPLAKIEPVKRAQNYRDSELMQGRIIARLSIPSSEKEGYPKYGLEPGQETFWWVQMDSAGTGGQSVFITTTKDGGVDVQPPRKLRRYVYEEDEEKVKRAIARWVWDLDDETTQGSCGGGSCR
jgi:hypothetical protein